MSGFLASEVRQRNVRLTAPAHCVKNADRTLADPPNNLARYECQLGNIEGAAGCLKRYFDLDPGRRLKAFKDPDLEPLWLSL